jgi:hypothetical protein
MGLASRYLKHILVIIIFCILFFTQPSFAYEFEFNPNPATVYPFYPLPADGAIDDYYVLLGNSINIYPLENDIGMKNISMIGATRIIKGDIDVHFYQDVGPDYYTFTPEIDSWGADQHWINLVGEDGQSYNSWVFIWVDVYPGDLNHDGFVEDDDLSILLSNWGEYRTYQKGNVWLGTHEDPINDDFVGIVDDADLSILLSWWREPGVDAYTYTPEPTTALFFLIGSTAILAKRKR